MPISKLKNIWKEITLLGTWVASVAGTFIIALPSWTNSTKTLESYTQFIVFFTTIIAGFLVLYSLKNKKIRRWNILSLFFFIALIFSFISYSYFRENSTLPYEQYDVIIGDVRLKNDPLTKIENITKKSVEREEILKHVQGDSGRIWTQEGINKNRIILVMLFTLSYTFTACFIISFCNLFLLNKIKLNKEKEKPTN